MSSIYTFEEEDNKDQDEIFRFIQDLEFVQCLANPNYLKYLSDKGYLDDDHFINYLKYLLYFKKDEYMKYITFERCLLFLDLLQYKEFREQLKRNNYIQINTPEGLKTFSYAQSLDDFILNDWVNRTRIKMVNNNENNVNNIKEEDSKDKDIDKNENKSNNDNQEMDIDI